MILVTGGAGFIGSHIVDALLAGGYEVRVLDARSPVNADAEQVRGDVADRGTVAQALRGVDAVCHQAAMVGLGKDMLDIADYARHNDLGTAVLLRELAAGGFDGRLVLASSMVVYGEGGYRCFQHGTVRAQPRALEDLTCGRFEPRCPSCSRPLEPVAIDESSPLDPLRVYAPT